MLTYDRFCGDMSWHPRIVDELSLEEEFWLPVIRDAKNQAMSTMQAVAEMQQNQPLQY